MASLEMIDVLKRLRELDKQNPNVHTDAIENTEKMNSSIKEGRVKDMRMDMEADAADMSKEEFIKAHGKSHLHIWDKVQKELKYGTDESIEEAKKLADKDYDGDGKRETPSQEYKGSKDKAIKKAMGKKEKTNESITISADSPEDLPVIAQIMKLAGMQTVTPDMMPDADNVPVMKADPTAGCGGEENPVATKRNGVDFDLDRDGMPDMTFDNSPEEQYKGVEDITTQTGYGDTNGPKAPQDLRVKDPSPYSDFKQRLAKLAGLETEETVTDQETEEGYDNEPEEFYKNYDPSIADKEGHGKRKVSYKPDGSADNPLESIENKLMKEYREHLKEKELTKPEAKEKERLVKGMKKSKADFKKRYGDRGEEVMYATATKMAKKNA